MFSSHVYGTTHSYDLNARRTSFTHPGSIAPTANAQRYVFTPSAGLLDTVVDIHLNKFAFRYDSAARVKGITRRAQVADSGWETMVYDALSRVIRRRQRATGLVEIHNDSLAYDLRDKVRQNTIVGDAVGYNTLGYLTSASNAIAGANESFRYDALGMRRFAATYGSGPSQSVYSYLANSERLQKAVHPQTPYSDTTLYVIDSDGAVGEEKRVHPFQSGQLIAFENRRTVNSYSGDRKLVQAWFRLDTVPTPTNPNYKVYNRREYYRYDALGRRVWQEMIRDTAQNVCFNHDRSSGCRNEVTRTVWDGDQVLYEIRAGADTVGLGSENDNASGVFNGRVGYTHALGIDAPLDLFKGTTVVVLYTDWRGRFDKGTCPATVCSGSTIYFPGSSENMYSDVPLLTDGPPSWYGNLINELRDGSGYQYKRNRYYDPVAGRFTQEDPIGLAGGANLYGFANSDPVTYSDPFGLSGCKKDEACSLATMAVESLKASVANAIDATIDVLGSIGNSLKDALPGLAIGAGTDLALAVVPVVGEVRAGRRVVAVGEAAGKFLSESRHIRGIKAAQGFQPDRRDGRRSGCRGCKRIGLGVVGRRWTRRRQSERRPRRCTIHDEEPRQGNSHEHLDTVAPMSRNLAQVIRAWISEAPSPGPAADLVTIRSGLIRATDAELEAILKEFFDVEPIVVEVSDIVSERDKPLPDSLRSRLAEALLFHGLDDAASSYLQ